MVRKFLCFLGFHKFVCEVWQIREDFFNPESKFVDMPVKRCERCGKIILPENALLK